jgi:hypothetical protein
MYVFYIIAHEIRVHVRLACSLSLSHARMCVHKDGIYEMKRQLRKSRDSASDGIKDCFPQHK